MLLENSRFPGDNRVRREAATLVEAGFDVTVIAPAGRGQGWYEEIFGVRVYRFPAPRGGQGLWGYAWEYGYCMSVSFLLSLWILLRHGFDVVHAHNPPDTFVLLGGFFRLLGKKFVFDHHDLSPEMYHARFDGQGSSLVHRVLVGLEWLSCRLANHVIATNESYKAMQMTRCGVPESRITVVRNGPDLARVRLVPPDQQLRQKAPTIIGYVGEMGFQDGLDYLLRALRHLIDDCGRSDFYCVLVGRGDAFDKLKALAAQLQLDDHVWFAGRVSDEELMRYLSTADICVDPDPSNPFTDRSTMIKLMEYMALGKPIVAFDLPEHRVTAGEAALYAQANNELDFARQIMSLMDDPAARAALGARGRRRIEERLEWRHQAQHLLEAYRRLCRARSTSAEATARGPGEPVLTGTTEVGATR